MDTATREMIGFILAICGFIGLGASVLLETLIGIVLCILLIMVGAVMAKYDSL